MPTTSTLPTLRHPVFVDKHGVRWQIRVAESGDRESLTEMYGAFGAGHRAQGLPPIQDHRLADWLDRLFEQGWNIVAARDGELLGHAVLTPIDAGEPELAVFVHPEYHGRGIGTELCRHVVARASASGCDAIVLDVERRNHVALSVYRSLGFEVVENARGELHMRLPLSDSASDALEPAA